MAAGDLNDPASNIPNIVLVDQSAATAAPGAGYGRLEVVNGVLGLRLGTGAWVALMSLAAGLLTALTEKVAPAGTDLVLLQDEADASALKKVQVSNLPGGAPGGGGGASSLFSYIADTDLASAQAANASVWTDLYPSVSHSFTVVDASSVVLISVRLSGYLSTGAASLCVSRLVIDAAGTPAYYPLTPDFSGSGDNYLPGGVVAITGLSAGAHTVKPQYVSSQNTTLYLRCGTQPLGEFYAISVVELLPPAA